MGFFLVWPDYQEISSIQSEIKEIENSIQKGEEYFTNLKSLSEKLEQYQDQLSVVDSALPKKFYLPQFYDFFPQICSRHGLLFQEVNCSFNPSGESRVQEISITLNVSGSYSSFRSFLSYLENSVRFFSIESINLSSAQEGKPFSISLNLKTYSY